MKYADWNAALTTWFFRPDLAGVPVYLAVDDDVLGEIAHSRGWQLSDPAHDFELAVRTCAGGSAPFDRLLRTSARWQIDGAEGIPPFIGVLAATVLAASRMAPGDDGGPGRYSYYGPLRKILDLPGTGMPQGFDQAAPVLWGWLKTWLTSKMSGKIGLPTAATRPAVDNIGWAFSQAVVLGADRTKIGMFFRATGVQPNEQIDESELLKRFQEWCRLSSRVSGRLRKAAFDPVLGPVLAQVMKFELDRFDGTMRDAAGRRCLPVVLTTADNGGAPFSVAIEVPPELQGSDLVLGNGEIVSLRVGQTWLTLPTAIASPSATVDLLSGRFRFLLPRRDCWVFQISEALGQWASVDVADIGVEHRVLVRAELQVAADEAMRATAGDPVQVRRATLPAGWVAFARYVPSRSALATPDVAALCPRAHELPSLSGGLCLSAADRVWLAEFPPDLVIPGEDGLDLGVTVDGRPYLAPDGGRPEIIRLSAMGLPEGQHEVSVGSRRLRFRLVDRLRETTLPARIAVRVLDDSTPAQISSLPVAVSSISSDWLSGAAFSSAARDTRPAPRTLVRQSSRIFVLGPGRAAAQIYPQQPSWLSEHGLYPADFDLEPALDGVPFEAEWVLSLLADCRKVLRVKGAAAMHGPAPSHRPLLLGEAEWKRLTTDEGPELRVDGSAQDADLWSAYARAGDSSV